MAHETDDNGTNGAPRRAPSRTLADVLRAQCLALQSVVDGMLLTLDAIEASAERAEQIAAAMDADALPEQAAASCAPRQRARQFLTFDGPLDLSGASPRVTRPLDTTNVEGAARHAVGVNDGGDLTPEAPQ